MIHRFRSFHCFQHTRSASLYAGVLGCLLLSFAVAQGQPLQTRVSNADYRYRSMEVDGTKLFVVEGIAPSMRERPELPLRRIDIPLPDASYTVQLKEAPFAGSYRAWPFYQVSYKVDADSTLDAVYHPWRDRSIVSDTVVSIRSLRIVRDGERWMARVELPLYTFDAARGTVRWVRSYLFETKRVASVASTGDARPGAQAGYYTQPFIRRSRDLDTSGAWIDISMRSVRLHVKRDGLYKLDKQWFVASGIDVQGIDPSRVRLLRKGKEIPLAATAFAGNRFGDADYFVFYGERNYDEAGYRFVPPSMDDPCPQYLNKYGDSTAYWLQFNGPSGQRIVMAAPPLTQPKDTTDWAFSLIHHEPETYLFAISTDYVRQQACEWTVDKTWFDTWSWTGKTVWPFEATHVRKGIAAKLWQKSGSWTSPASLRPNHRVAVSLNNGALLDSVVYDLNGIGIVATRAHVDEVRDGANTFEVTNIKFYEGDNAIYLDWWDVEYARFLVAAAPAFQFGVDREMGLGLRVMAIDSLQGSDPLILRRRGEQFSQLAPASFANGRLCFADTLLEGTQYMIRDRDSLLAPPVGTSVTVADLRATNAQASYLIITAAPFGAVCAQYAAFVQQQYGVEARVVTVESIYDNYSFGMFNPEAIKVFLYDTWTKWQQKPPKYVFFVGDANYNYKAAPTPQTTNYVPTYGFPVSDVWFASFDSLALEPSYAVGRITAHSSAEVLAYLEKHRAMLTQPADEFNKTTLHFSGGSSADSQEKLDELRNINEAVIQQNVLPMPYAGTPVHFYKTKTPPTDFGPYSVAYVQEKIGEGGVVISYLGHAAIRTWDNTIGDPSQLRNDKNRASLVSDFGCSTSKFADPDGAAFAELFVVPEGTQSIGYIGNSAIGFTTTAAVMPVLFYKALLRDGYTSIGEAHRRAKLDMINLYGRSTVNKVAVQSNTLIGDPIARLPIPVKPNAVAHAEWLRPSEEIFTNAMDTLVFRAAWANLGTLRSDSVTVTVRDLYAGSPRWTRSFRRALPRLFDTLRVAIPSGNLPGNHALEVTVDSDNRIDEADESDNVALLPFAVLSTHLQVVNATFGRASAGWPNARLLNPMLTPGAVTQVEFQFDTVATFPSPVSVLSPYGKTVTHLSALPPLAAEKRWYWRARLALPSGDFVGPFEFWNTSPHAAFTQRDSTDLARDQRSQLQLTREGLRTVPGKRTLAVIGSGYNDGNYGTVELDGRNLLPTTFGRGYYVVILDSANLAVDSIASYDTYENPDACLQLNAFLLRQPFGKLVAISTMDDPYPYHSDLIAGLRSIGSWFADTLGVYTTAFRGNFAIIGRHGARRGSVPEAFHPKFAGKASIDTSYVAPADTGMVTSVAVGPAARWRSLRLRRSPVAESTIALSVLGVKDGAEPVLLLRADNVDTLDLSFVDAAAYPRLQFRAELIPRIGSPSPLLTGWDVDYAQRAELALNYQSVVLTPDSVERGTPATLRVGIVNAGESGAPASSASIDAIGTDNVRRNIAQLALPALGRDAWFDTTITISTVPYTGPQRLLVQADAADAVPEQFETNNVAALRLGVQRDTVRPLLTVLFDGQTPPDGDYIRPTPVVTLRLADGSPLKVTDPANFSVTLDDSAVSAQGMAFVPMSASSPAILTWSPQLQTGEHLFRFNAKDYSGNLALSSDMEVRVLVDTDGKVLDLTNYPNPFADATAFLFTLTGATVPDDVQVKVYTVSGRLIRTLTAHGDQLRIGLNTLPWDGRDEDGDLPANGVYFYKFIVRSASGAIETLGKIAKLK